MSARQNSEFKEIVSALAEEQEDLPHLKNLSRRDRKAAETRIRLFRCALQLFADRGFPNVTVEDITEAADVGKGTFFNYFASKDHVLGVMAEIQIGKVREALAQATGDELAVGLLGPGPGQEQEIPRPHGTDIVARRSERADDGTPKPPHTAAAVCGAGCEADVTHGSWRKAEQPRTRAG